MKLSTIGTVELVSVGKRAIDVPAKIDTGADSSAIWASNISVDEDGTLKFSLFGEGSPYYNGKVFKRTDFSVVKVKSSNGQSEIRYRTHFSIEISGRRINALMNLADRSKNSLPILIGKRTIAGKFLVDVTKNSSLLGKPTAKKRNILDVKLKKNPHEFHKKYVNIQKEVV